MPEQIAAQWRVRSRLPLSQFALLLLLLSTSLLLLPSTATAAPGAENWEYHGHAPLLLRGSSGKKTAPGTVVAFKADVGDEATAVPKQAKAAPNAQHKPSRHEQLLKLMRSGKPVCTKRHWDGTITSVPCKTVHQAQQAPKARSTPVRGAHGRMLKSANEAPPQRPRAFKVDLTCRAKRPEVCAKAEKAFDMASQILGNVLILNEPLTVNATLYDLCARPESGCQESRQILGGASPARSILRKDDDGLFRMYPQAMMKQLNLTEHASYDRYDINAEFNSEADFWFEGDGPIQKKQTDFLFVIVHEIIHGLGFLTSWNDYINAQPTVLMPSPLPDGVVDDQLAEFEFIGFFENAFDKYLVELPTLNRTSGYTQMLNKFNGGIGVKYDNQGAFVEKFVQSPEYAITRRMMNISSVYGNLGFMPKGGSKAEDVILLETGLDRGFTPGSSIAHVSYATYTKSSDFLMRYLQDPGTMLKSDISVGGNFPGGAIGPNLLRILETLGYTINKNPSPLVMEMNAGDQSAATSARLAADGGRWSLLSLPLLLTVSLALMSMLHSH